MDDFRSDPLWELLGRARRPEPSPWLTTRIMAAVRSDQEHGAPLSVRKIWRWLAIPAGIAAVVLSILAINGTSVQKPAESSQLFAAFEAFANNTFEADYLWSNDSF